jgi:hypothetical protein
MGAGEILNPLKKQEKSRNLGKIRGRNREITGNRGVGVHPLAETLANIMITTASKRCSSRRSQSLALTSDHAAQALGQARNARWRTRMQNPGAVSARASCAIFQDKVSYTSRDS